MRRLLCLSVPSFSYLSRCRYVRSAFRKPASNSRLAPDGPYCPAPPMISSQPGLVQPRSNSLEPSHLPDRPSRFSPRSPPRLEIRHDNRPVLRRRRERPIALHDEIHRQTQLAQAMVPTHGGGGGVLGAGDGLGVVRDAGHVVAAAHELLELARAAAGVRVEDLHHVLLGVR
ncbi:hypothetical protein F4825DRAFT_77569 [Nemania diffusa]|nr:hypothetical protein F4825DRAFT_77569 [Nemania diffusa]